MSAPTEEAEVESPVRSVRATGMVVDLSGSTGELIDAIDEIKDAERELGEVKKAVVNVIAHRADKANLRELASEKHVLKINAPTKVEVDAEKLGALLYDLVEAGVIDSDVRDAVVPADFSYSVRVRELNKLRGHADPRVGEAIEACSTTVEQTRSVSITGRS